MNFQNHDYPNMFSHPFVGQPCSGLSLSPVVFIKASYMYKGFMWMSVYGERRRNVIMSSLKRAQSSDCFDTAKEKPAAEIMRQPQMCVEWSI